MIPIDEITSVASADVYKGDAIAGRLHRTSEGTEFRYTDEWVEANGEPVASTLPVRTLPFATGAGAVPPFFAGLLPEGARLQAVIRAVRTSADDELSLLLAIGGDTVGDVRISPSGVPPRTRSGGLPKDPSQVVFREILHAATDPTDGPMDSAVPGVQEKISDSMISFPIKRTRRPALLKLDPDAYPNLTRNEAFFLSLARDTGFAVPKHELIVDRVGETGLLVERFDRQKDDADGFIRLGQEDGCQLLNRYPADKYRVTVNDLAARVVEVATSPAAAVLDLILQAAFSWAIGNGDLHAKNFSMQWRTDGVVVPTPVYDVISTLPYALDQHMAMKLDGRDANFRPPMFASFGERYGVPTKLTLRRLSQMADRALPHISRFSEIGYDTATTDRMTREITSRFTTLQ